MTFWQAVSSGGITLVVLVLCSVFSIAIIMERMIYYRRRSRVKRTDLVARIRQAVKAENIQQAVAACRSADTPFARVAQIGLNLAGHNEVVVSNAMEREITVEATKLERYTSIVGTIGSTAVYIGLFGTVLGIIRAFRDISLGGGQGAAGMNVVVRGISEALVCTAAGLAVAVPAVIAYNYFVKRIEGFVSDMELCASEVMDILNLKEK
jgi:biopolymer transport protein ExbB/TolQ